MQARCEAKSLACSTRFEYAIDRIFVSGDESFDFQRRRSGNWKWR